MAGDVTGFVVAGGRSRRMRRDKALLPWGAGTLLDHAVDRLRGVEDDVRILCGAEPRYAERGLPILTDAVADAGALGGVLTGLQALDRPAGLFLAVDLPLVTVELLRRLLDLAPGWDAVVPVASAGPEPLCAVYARACLDPVRRRIQAGELKMTAFWADVRVREVTAAELAPFGEPDRLFLNVNEPATYAELTRPLRAR
jgi:molybdopterin-guanine dinucleotide biosynthesis protein A